MVVRQVNYNLARYQRRQAQIAKIDRWLKKHERWGWLIAALFAMAVLEFALLLKATLDLLGD